MPTSRSHQSSHKLPPNGTPQRTVTSPLTKSRQVAKRKSGGLGSAGTNGMRLLLVGPEVVVAVHLSQDSALLPVSMILLQSFPRLPPNGTPLRMVILHLPKSRRAVTRRFGGSEHVDMNGICSLEIEPDEIKVARLKQGNVSLLVSMTLRQSFLRSPPNGTLLKMVTSRPTKYLHQTIARRFGGSEHVDMNGRRLSRVEPHIEQVAQLNQVCAPLMVSMISLQSFLRLPPNGTPPKMVTSRLTKSQQRTERRSGGLEHAGTLGMRLFRAEL